MKASKLIRLSLAAAWLLAIGQSCAAELITNAYGRKGVSLNGKWEAIVDQYDQGERMEVWKNQKPESGEQFFEYSFDGTDRLNVPGDWNSQRPELQLYEGSVWYGRKFDAKKQADRRAILYFAGVSYRADVYLNGEKIGSHEGSFTPFQFDVTDKLLDGENFLVVKANNTRAKDAIPAMAFDWWNYGGITRDVMLLDLPEGGISEYFVRLDKEKPNRILVDAALAQPLEGEMICVSIPELNKTVTLTTDAEGKASGSIDAGNGLRLWEPGAPMLYDVTLASRTDTVSERIGFRTIEVDGTEILINGKPQFMRSVSFHEEIPQRMGRAFSKADATMLLNEAKELGVNMIRLAHYPQNEHIVRMAEEMGIVLWEEIPIWQGIDFADDATREKAQTMLREMISRDRNRCAVGFWGVANETKPSAERNDFLKSLLEIGRGMDDTRLYVAAFDLVYFDKEKGIFTMDDDFAENLDVVAVNKYMGWYHPWPMEPKDCRWEVNMDKPLIISEFGGEALAGQDGDEEAAWSWGEKYQLKLFQDNVAMFENIANLRGISPWVLFDFRSPFRFHPKNQQGWNRKGLVSDRGERKKAWRFMRDYYKKKKEQYEK
ncbi:MAG: hypothetical protein NC102_07790 [Clostridium sp.]|nr:hypothetical protein [Clostridium sp.]